MPQIKCHKELLYNIGHSPLKIVKIEVKHARLKMHILKHQPSENIYLTFIAYSSNMTSEMTHFTVFSRLCQKSNIFRLFSNSEA